MRQRLQRRRRVVNLDHERRRRMGRARPREAAAPSRPVHQIVSAASRHHDSAGAGRERRGGKVGAVESLATNRDVQLAGAERPGVDRHAGEIARRISRHQIRRPSPRPPSPP